ncbi:MAG: TerB family tellurite resistance protein [Bacteroidetes bacterium]|nr:TerB family tellurite resistance protein [Bacteroidota bacterium]MBU1116029.1 TerB family tellurite resistance protein [Bacteroidota bacterium]MBU1799203.1 TerB family tellurite resistance protein [Bacteroidota bacterium]
MKLTLLDRSAYFKGLLLLIKRDNQITEGEKKLMTKIGQTLGFDKSFIESAVKELLENEFITDYIQSFSDRSIAESFILDGLKVAFADNEFSAEELEHLTKIASQNGIDREWLMLLIAKYIKHSDDLNTSEFLFVTKYLKDEKIEAVDIKS